MSTPLLLLKAGVTSGTIMTVADVLAQGLETNGFRAAREGEAAADCDWGRTARFALVGLTLHGPYFQAGFAKVDAFFGPTLSKAGRVRWAVLAMKVGATQFVLNAPFMALLFGWMGVLEGRRSPADVWQNIRDKWPAAFWAGNLFWPCAKCVARVCLLQFASSTACCSKACRLLLGAPASLALLRLTSP